MKKRLIEYDLPMADISEESAREKNIRHGHPSRYTSGGRADRWPPCAPPPSLR
jgi:hypothetical protein